MRRVFLAVAIAAAAVLAAGPAFAQVKLPTLIVTPKIQTAPAVRAPVAPIIKIMPPSMVARNVLVLFPGGKIISIKPDGGGKHYAVKLKIGNKIVKQRVDAVSGALVQ